MQYKIVSGSGWTPGAAIIELEKVVNDLIKEGWEPLGGAMIVAMNDNVYQTLIKKDVATIGK